MIRKIILSAVILVSATLASYAQTFTITITPLSDHTAYEGSTRDYSVTYTNLPASYQFEASAFNGSVIPIMGGGAAPSIIRVQWNCTVGNGSVSLKEKFSGTSGSLPVVIVSFISDPVNYCSLVSPLKQNNYTGATPTNLTVSFCSPYCIPGNPIYHYQWQVGDVPIGTFPQDPTTWTDISGANLESYQPPIYNVECIKAYRRVTTFTVITVGPGGTGGSPTTYTRYSYNAVISTFNNLLAGTITAGAGGISQTPATGGLCDGFNYIYNWEWKTYNGPGGNWDYIGSGINFPGGVVIPTSGLVTIRRQVICGGVSAYTNNLYFNAPPLEPGSINYNGPTSLTYNTVPNIIQVPASGSVCDAAGYLYSWERSVENSAWVTISGTGINSIDYPAGVGLVGNTRFRRKVRCSIENVDHVAYSNILSFTLIGYTPPVAENLNYIRSKSVLMPGVGSVAQLNNLAVSEQIQETEYIDGLGRTIQTVIKENSPLKKDIVSMNQYDEFGLESIKRLPFVSTPVQTGNIDNDGKFKGNALIQQNAFYNGSNSPIYLQGENFFYRQFDFEQSPLKRISKTFEPGNSWMGTRGSGAVNEKSAEIKYLFNTKIGDDVRIFNISTSPGSVPASSGSYNDGELLKSIIIDEAKRQVVEFKDKDGKIILKKVQLANTVTDGYAGWLCTYYIYDDLNLLRVILPPKATDLYLNGAVISNINNELCFNYDYDQQQRLIMKKMPGAAKVWMVYDQRDKLIMMQDGNLSTAAPGANKKWLVTEYDLQNRPIRTGLLSNNNDQTYHASQASLTFPYPNLSSGYELLTEIYYDNYNWTSGTLLPSTVDASNFNINGYFEPANTSPLYASALVVDYNTKGLITGTKTKVLGTTGQFTYRVNFYDNRQRLLQSQNTNLAGATDINTNQYDFSGKILRTLLQQQVNPSSGTQKHLVNTVMEYDHAGRLLKIIKNLRSIVNGHTIVSFPRKILVANSYDELGELKIKKLGQKPGTTSELETLTYDYNIRGWPLGMNRNYLTTQGQMGTTKFGYELGYDKINNSTGENFLLKQFTGNITGMIWKSDGDDIRRKYDFSYDNADRLWKADFVQHNAPQNDANDNLWNKNRVNYGVNMGNGSSPVGAYDANGNILAMTQFGLKLGQSPTIPIDDLTYSYMIGSDDNRNKLQQILDGSNDKDSKLGDFKYNSNTKTSTDYTYDANGNITRDLNKSIINYTGSDGIVYNHLNLTSTIFIKKEAVAANKAVINYSYDAAGSKLRKVVIEYDVPVNYNNTVHVSSITTTTDYISGFIYETKKYSDAGLSPLEYNYTLQSISHEEGRIRVNPGDYTVNPPVYGNFNFDFFIKDHLGNVRMVITDEDKEDKYPAATLEDAFATTEETFYSNLPQARRDYPLGYPENSPPGNKRVAIVNGLYGGGPKIGPGIVLKVMAGDKFNAKVDTWYKINTPTGGPHPPNGISYELLNALTNGVGNLPGVKGSPFELEQAGVFIPGVGNYLNNQTTLGDINKPWAFLNWVLFDEQFNYVGSSSGFQQVPSESVYNNGNIPNNNTDPITRSNMPIDKNGFLYIYVSNETPDVDVCFDNLQVTHIRGALLEETHYYPFGLKMAGISSKAANIISNKIKYNTMELQSEEFNDGGGLEMYEYKYRFYDQQIGRFISQDQLASNFPHYAPYQFAGNQVPNAIDLDGREQFRVHQNDQGVKVVTLENFNRPFNVIWEDGTNHTGFPQQNMNDWYTNDVIMMQGGASNGINTTNYSAMVVLGSKGKIANTVPNNTTRTTTNTQGADYVLYKSKEFDIERQLTPTPAVTFGNLGVNVAEFGNVGDNAPTQANNPSTVGIFGNGTRIAPGAAPGTGAVVPGTTAIPYAFVYSSLGNEVNTFTLTYPISGIPGTPVTTVTFTGSTEPGQFRTLMIVPGTLVNVNVTGKAGSSTDKFNYQFYQVNTPLIPIMSSIPR